MDVYERTAASRRRAADFFDGLDEQQLSAQSLCGAWTVRQVLGHLAMPLATSTRTFLWRIVRARGSLDRASVSIATDLSRRPVGDLTQLLRDRAGDEIDAAIVGPMGQLTDACVHLRDCARPLGLPADVALDDWRLVLDWLPTKQASRGLVPRGRLDGLSLHASDQDWSWGAGSDVAGPSEALAMAVTGRRVALDDLQGSGVAALRERL